MQSEKLIEVLEGRFGVPREFAKPLLPVLERVAAQYPSSDEWNTVLGGVARAYLTSKQEASGEMTSKEADPRDADEAGVNEVSSLMNQFSSELRKLDESLKVLSVYLDRVHQQLHPSLGSRLLH